MEISLLLSMSGFALAMSISPGPVNLVALGTGARYGFPASLRHVVGATLGFILLLLLMGLGLGGALSRWPVAAGAIHWGGVLFLCFVGRVPLEGRGQRGGGVPQGPPRHPPAVVGGVPEMRHRLWALSASSICCSVWASTADRASSS
ncbi:LysE family transporter, partial [Aeromonas media]